jgi:hypothetical protein
MGEAITFEERLQSRHGHMACLPRGGSRGGSIVASVISAGSATEDERTTWAPPLILGGPERGRYGARGLLVEPLTARGRRLGEEEVEGRGCARPVKGPRMFVHQES